MGAWFHEDYARNLILFFAARKSVAAEGRISPPEFVTQAVQEKLASTAKRSEKPSMTGFGKLRRLRDETARINRLVEEEFEQVEPGDRL